MNLTKCTNPELRRRLPEFEMGLLGDADRDDFEAHLMTCPFCLSEVRAMQPFAASATQQREQILNVLQEDGLTYERLRRELSNRPEPFWNKFNAWLSSWYGRTSLAGAVATAVILIFLIRATTPSPYLNDLSFAVPGYNTDMTMRGGGENLASELFESAMQSYVHGDFATAAVGIQHSLELDSKPADRWLYLGVSQFAQHDSKNAIKSLKQALASGEGPTKLQAEWYLAESYLLAGQVKPARPLLQALISENSIHAEESRLLLSKLTTHR